MHHMYLLVHNNGVKNVWNPSNVTINLIWLCIIANRLQTIEHDLTWFLNAEGIF